MLRDFDAVSLYPNLRSDEKSVYPRIAPGYAVTPNMNDEFVENFNFQYFIQSVISNKKFYNPKHLIFQHIPASEKEENQKLILCVLDFLQMF